MNEQPEALQLPTLPIAVFDEFGQPCEDRVRDHFAAAFEELRKDAERYRWLKEFYSPECIGRYMTDIDRGWYGDGIDLDDAIDASMKGQS